MSGWKREERRDETRENVERATNEVVQSSYQRLATKRSISSNRRGRNYPYNSYYWVPRHVKIENERRADEIDIRGTSAVVERVFSLFDYWLTPISFLRPFKSNFTACAKTSPTNKWWQITVCAGGFTLIVILLESIWENSINNLDCNNCYISIIK